jgi:N-acetylglucosaminyldiphosphoundecaprenol N-acetyl-beta-D-mannosaminyltransferase
VSPPGRPVFGFVPNAIDTDAVVALVRDPPDRMRLAVTPNLDHVVRLRRDAAFRDAYRRASLVLCDGFPVQIYARLHSHRARRVTGCDLVAGLLRRPPADDRERWFFVVDQAPTATAVERWAAGSRQIDVAVPAMGFVHDETTCAALASRIAAHRTTLLVMAVGAPQSEIFVDRWRASLPPCWAVCVGQAVKAGLGLVRRAPGPVRALHLEWLWRVVQEPRRLGRRYGLGAPSFMVAVLDDLRRPVLLDGDR